MFKTLYKMISLFFFLPVILLSVSYFCVYCTHASCVPQYSYSNNVEVTWEASSEEPDNVMVLSEPLCLNEHSAVIVRTCYEDEWLPFNPPTCYSTKSYSSSHLKSCPNNFLNNGDHCIFISPPDSWEEDCVTMPATKYDTSSIQLNFSVWLPVKRVAKFGPWEYMTPEEDYGDPFARFMNYQEYENKCVIANAIGEPELVSCSDKYFHVCAVPNYYKWYDCMKKCKNKKGCMCMMATEVDHATEYDQCRVVGPVLYDDSEEDGEESEHPEKKSVKEDKSCTLPMKNHASDVPRFCTLCIYKYTDTNMVLAFVADRKQLYLTVYNWPRGKFTVIKVYAITILFN